MNQVPKKSLVDAATDAIRDRILDLSLPPGKAINNAHLVETLALSRTPIREALNRLAAEGLIRFEANHGVFVHALDLDEINQIMDAYAVAERISAFYCDFSDRELLADVERIQRDQRQAVREHRYLEASAWNARFRSRIAQTSGNRHLVEFHRRIVNHARRLSVLVYRIEAADPAYYEAQIRLLERLHRELDATLAAADRERLVAVLTEHAAIFRSRIAKVFSRGVGEDFVPG